MSVTANKGTGLSDADGHITIGGDKWYEKFKGYIKDFRFYF